MTGSIFKPDVSLISRSLAYSLSVSRTVIFLVLYIMVSIFF